MQSTTILEDLYLYNNWANGRLLNLSLKLDDSQLDQPREMGFGSLRNTLFHILAAEEIWFERWNGDPWRAFPTDAEGLSLNDMAERLQQVNSRRQSLLDRERSDGWRQAVHYKDAKGSAFSVALGDLALHVANHGIHHRAQALSFLKSFGQTVPGGLDYVFYRLAHPFFQQEPSTAAALQQWGLEIAASPGKSVAWDARLIEQYCAYGDWANDRVLRCARELDDAALDRSWNIGMGTIRKTALHIADAERWWYRNWTVGPSHFEKASELTTVAQHCDELQRVIERRNLFISGLDAESAQRVVMAIPGGFSVGSPVVETLIQLCGHGTHHRAQMINMLRHSGIKVPPVDLGLWVRESAARDA